MPKLKFTKEVIVDAAYDILKEEGFESISVRKIAKKLNCSTAPIYFNFETVEKVKEEVINLCEKKLNNYFHFIFLLFFYTFFIMCLNTGLVMLSTVVDNIVLQTF